MFGEKLFYFVSKFSLYMKCSAFMQDKLLSDCIRPLVSKSSKEIVAIGLLYLLKLT